MEAIGQLIQSLESQPRWRTHGHFRKIVARWATLVGPNVARQSEPVKLARGVLYVAVANAAWAQTLTLERIRILDKLNQQLSLSLNDIRFSPGDWWQRSRQQQTPPPQNALKSHPSYWPETRPIDGTSPENPHAAFQRWAHHHQYLAAQQPLCPKCSCHCPSGELQRWQQCSICAAKNMAL